MMTIHTAGTRAIKERTAQQASASDDGLSLTRLTEAELDRVAAAGSKPGASSGAGLGNPIPK